jgi:AraC family ethanolamine operon transcriptional activator
METAPVLESAIAEDNNSTSQILTATDLNSNLQTAWIEGFQVSEGNFEIDLREIILPEVTVRYFYSKYKFMDCYTVPADLTMIAFMMLVSHPAISWCHHIEPTANFMAVQRSTVEYTSSLPPGWLGVDVIVSNELLDRCDLLPHRFWERLSDQCGGAAIQLPPKAIAKFRRFLLGWRRDIEFLYGQGQLDPGCANQMRDELLDRIQLLFDLTFTDISNWEYIRPKVSRRYWIYHQSREIIESDLFYPHTSMELCQAIQVSRRALEYAFQQIAGCSPNEYIRSRKLTAIRQELKQAKPGSIRVSEVASRYGFRHFGRFSSQFRALFGELPSEALASY